jgi:hypothetical protein
MINRDRFQEFIDKAAEKTRFSENTYLIFLSFVVGVSTGLGAVAFRWLILSFSDLFFGHGIAWMIPLVPMAGGLLVGPIVYFYASEAKGHGVPEVMAAVADKTEGGGCQGSGVGYLYRVRGLSGPGGPHSADRGRGGIHHRSDLQAVG